MNDKFERGSARESVAHLESALQKHAAIAAQQVHAKLGTQLSSSNLNEFLQFCLRFPTVLQFDDRCLERQQFAQPRFVGCDGDKSCVLNIRPQFHSDAEALTFIVAYMAATVNYGEAASSSLCEEFGANLMGMEVDDFYSSVCKIADRIDSCR